MNLAKSILFSAVAALAATLSPANAAEYFTETVAGLEWTYRIENGGAVIESGEEYECAVTGDCPTDLLIPTTLGGRPVRALGIYACCSLWRMGDVETVSIPDSVTSIGKCAFDSAGVRSINLPSKLETIGDDAFIWCDELTHIFLPASVKDIGLWAFYECRGLSSIEVDASNPVYCGENGVLYSKDRKTIVCVPAAFSGSFSIPQGVTRIATGAFASCRKLTSVSIPNGVTDIGKFAFGECGLKTVRIPASVTNIGWGAFTGYSEEEPSVKSVTVAAGNPSYVVVGGALFTTDRKTLVCVPDGMSGHYAIPSGVTRIGGYAFNSCESLTGITIPDTVTEIEEGAFSGGCYGLTELTIPSSVTKIGSYAFTACDYLRTLTLPASCMMEIGEGTFEDCLSLESITIPVGVTNIGKEAFWNCANLTAVVIPDSVLAIEKRAFAECSSLETLTIPASVTFVGKDVFAECDALKQLSVPASWKGTAMLESAAVPSGCTVVYQVSPLELGATSQSFTADAANGQMLAVTASVAWTAQSSASWLTVATASGTGNGTVTYNVAANAGMSSRTGTITVSGGGLSRTFTVTQGGAAAKLELAASERGFTADMASGQTLAVTANVEWTAKSSVTWLTVATAIGSGNGTITYSVAANTGAGARTGMITVSGGGLSRTFTVTQEGATEKLELGSACQSFTADAASGQKLAVTANLAWTAKSSATWLTVKTTSGSGNGTITYNVAANTEAGSRTGTITVSGGSLLRMFTVTQEGQMAQFFPDARDAVGVAFALSGTEDKRLGTRIATVEEYDAFREWIAGKGLAPQAVKASAHAWPSYALGAGKLFGDEPAIQIDGVSVGRGGAKGAGGGAVMEVRVTVRDGGSAVEVDAEKVAGLFRCTGDPADWDGEASLVPSVTPKGADGNTLLFEVAPGNGSAARAFLRLAEAAAGEGAEAMYLVVDLSAGPNATSYSVTYLNEAPTDGFNTDEYKTTKLVLRRIQAGTFTMGCAATEMGYYGWEAVPHEVTVSQPFFMGVFEVTQKQWELVMGSNPSTYAGGMRPVEGVGYSDIRGSSAGAGWPGSPEVDAASFMGKLRARAGGLAWDLPTEAQWEHACRAGTTTALNTGKNLAGPNQDSAMAEAGRYAYNPSDGKGGYSQHTTVGSYLPNTWGLYDMHGNVWEWCLDWWQDGAAFTAASATDPLGPASGSYRLLRGGSWSDPAQYCRSASRGRGVPAYKANNYGFRLCCPAGLP